MAHFAELDENNVVLRVLVVDNKDILDENGQEQEAVGVQFLTNLFGHSRWKQTSYNAKFRKGYAGVGWLYSSEHDAFLAPKPYASWTLNEDSLCWQPPISRPEDFLTGNPPKEYWWKEETQEWKYLPPPPEDAGEEKIYVFNQETEEWEISKSLEDN